MLDYAGTVTGYRLRLDAKRRPTLPTALLEEAGEVAEGLAESSSSGDLSDELIAERTAEARSD